MDDFQFEVCIRQIQQGEKEGLKLIYQAYVGLIFSVVYDMTGQKEDAQDITSEFFIRLWNKADTYRFGGKHKGWLLTMARNMTIDYLRKHRRELPMEEKEEEFLSELPDDKTELAEEVVANQSMQEAMKLLKPAEQEVLDLKILGGFTFTEIANLLKKPMGTVTWLYRNGIGKLRTHYKKEVRE